MERSNGSLVTTWNINANDNLLIYPSGAIQWSVLLGYQPTPSNLRHLPHQHFNPTTFFYTSKPAPLHNAPPTFQPPGEAIAHCWGVLQKFVANLLLSSGKSKCNNEGEKFIKHVCEILFKCKGKIHGDVHMAHNHASVCSACNGIKHLIWDEHFLSLFAPSKPPPSFFFLLTPATLHLLFSLPRSLSVTARNHNHKIIKMLFGCH